MSKERVNKKMKKKKNVNDVIFLFIYFCAAAYTYNSNRYIGRMLKSIIRKRPLKYDVIRIVIFSIQRLIPLLFVTS